GQERYPYSERRGHHWGLQVRSLATPLLSSDLSRLRRRPSADLLHERQQIADSPVVGDFAVLYAHHVNGFEMNFAMRRSNSEEWPIVRTVIGFVGRHSISVHQLPVNLRMKVRKRLAHVGVELPVTSLIGGGSGLCGVIHEIVREEFFEDIEVAFALD